jgi:hypothetical protein
MHLRLLYVCILSFVSLFPVVAKINEPTIPVSYLLLLKELTLGRARGTQDTESDADQESQSSGQIFINLFRESIEDGFFGGVKWGVAACFYQILYELSSDMIGVLPAFGRIIKRVTINCFNKISNRPPAIDVYTLSVLTQLFTDVLSEFEETLLIKDYDVTCRNFNKEAVRAVCLHIIEYLSMRYEHYAGSLSQRQWLVHSVQSMSGCDSQEVAFVIVLIIQDLRNILQRLDELQCHKELMHCVRAVSLAFTKLSMLLVGVQNSGGSQSAQSAWFSGK